MNDGFANKRNYSVFFNKLPYLVWKDNVWQQGNILPNEGNYKWITGRRTLTIRMQTWLYQDDVFTKLAHHILLIQFYLLFQPRNQNTAFLYAPAVGS